MDAMSYALGLLTTAPVLAVAALITWLSDRARTVIEPAETAARFELVELVDGVQP